MYKFKKQALRAGFLILLLCLPFSLLAQGHQGKFSKRLQTILLNTEAQQTVAAFIYFKDKGGNVEQKLADAKAALSPRSLQRRTINRGADNVVDFTDIPLNQEYLEAVKTEVTKIRHQLKSLNAVSVEATPAALANISEFGFVERIEQVNKVKRTPDPVVTPDKLKEDSSSLLQPQSATSLDYGASYTQNNQINVPAVHDLGYNGSGVIIAVLDSGFNRLTHESFNQMDIAGTWDFVNGDSDVGDGSDMGTGFHGTYTLSTIGGYSPGDLIGPAYGATFYLAKTENTDSELHVEEDNWCAAAEWAETNGAQIISSSLGYKDFDTGVNYTAADMDGDTTVITKCADLAATKGIIVINSAGNSGDNDSVNTLSAPSDGHFVLATGAVTSSGTRSSFSSVGPSADGRIKPDVMAMGTDVRVANYIYNTGYVRVSGTSFSCPLTAGVAALVLESSPNLTAAQFRNILRNTADNASSPNKLYGYGIIDALAAVQAAATLNASFKHVARRLQVTFTDSSTVPSGSTITGWAWNFGDGSTSVLQSPVHTYAAANTYNVSLTVTSSDGGTDSVTKPVTVVDTPIYCRSNGKDFSVEWIGGVNVGTFSNTSGAAGYSNFTAKVINVTTGRSYRFVLSPGYASDNYPERWRVWIDFNQNGDFTDAGERVIASYHAQSDVIESIVIPASATTGNTRMRVSMKYRGNSSPCGTFKFGEVEDYTVNISN